MEKSNLESELIESADLLHAGDTIQIGIFEIKPGGNKVKYYQVYKEDRWVGDRPTICAALLCVCREMLESNDYSVEEK